MKIQSNLFDRFVDFAGRNLTGEKKKGNISLEVGDKVQVYDKEFMITSTNCSQGTGGYKLSITLEEAIDGKVV